MLKQLCKMENIKEKLSSMAQSVIDGDVSAIKIFIQMKQLSKHLDNCLSKIKSDVKYEMKNEKSIEKDGFTIEIRSGGKMFDFKNCTSWINAKTALSGVEEILKLNFHASQQGMGLHDSNGEEPELPTITYKKDSIVVLPKRI